MPPNEWMATSPREFYLIWQEWHFPFGRFFIFKIRAVGLVYFYSLKNTLELHVRSFAFHVRDIQKVHF